MTLRAFNKSYYYAVQLYARNILRAVAKPFITVAINNCLKSDMTVDI